MVENKGIFLKAGQLLTPPNYQRKPTALPPFWALGVAFVNRRWPGVAINFDARVAKTLKANASIVIQGCQGLRLEAKTASKSWIYRYKSPGDQRMRQVKIGTWPEMGFPSAVVAWEALRGVREAGQDPSFERGARRVSEAQEKDGPYTVLRVVEDYLQHHIERHREPKNARALRSKLLRGIASIACFEPSKVTRGVAFS